MIRINLLAPESIAKEERSEIMLIAYAVMVLCVLLGAFVYVTKYRAYKGLETRIVRTEKELGNYEAIVRQVDALQATRNTLVSKKTVIRTLMASRLLYPRFMEEILQLLPSNIWFRSLTTQTQGEGKLSITLDADSLDNYSIADFISALNAIPMYSGVELGPIATAATGRTAVSSFRLTFQYQKAKQ